MRIVLVCPIYPPRPGGLADHTAAWARAIGGHLGHEVVVLTGPGAEDQHDPRVSLAEPLEVWHGARFREAILALQP
ncbi:MAG: hypothetical protein VKP62_06470, partial [Candidatus Sericytochromatia bacterium]|nr:hypothetical protein [Candidatus Sericytochromatia bacterium]